MPFGCDILFPTTQKNIHSSGLQDIQSHLHNFYNCTLASLPKHIAERRNQCPLQRGVGSELTDCWKVTDAMWPSIHATQRTDKASWSKALRHALPRNWSAKRITHNQYFVCRCWLLRDWCKRTSHVGLPSFWATSARINSYKHALLQQAYRTCTSCIH